MSGYTVGKKRKVVRFLESEAFQNGTKFYKKVEFDCGHIGEVCMGLSPNHYRVGGREEPKTGRCIPCWKKENGLA